MEILRELGDLYHEAEALDHLGDAWQAAGDPVAARDAWQRAATLLEQLDHPDAGPVRAKLGDPGPDQPDPVMPAGHLS